jgi:DNA-binding NarL/FixJ family response regulator
MTSDKPSPLPTAGKKRILVVDDHPLFRHGMAALVNAQPDLEVCCEAASPSTALEAMRSLKPDGVVLDISLPGTNGVELLKTMRAESPRLPILMLSMHDESLYALRVLRAGAQGYIMKTEALNHILTALRKVLAGETYVSPVFGEKLIVRAIQSMEAGLGSPVDHLSDRELEVLEHIGNGHTTREIAEILHLSIKTIETHRAHIKKKLGFKEPHEMAQFAVDWVSQKTA